MKIGNIDIDNPVVLAPMEDVTDKSFRIIAKKLGADIVYTEFISSEGLIRNAAKALKKLEMFQDEHPIGVQLYGGNIDSMVEAVKISEEVRPDLIDINCGCWVKKVAGRGEGAGLLKDLPRMEKMVSAIVKIAKLPVTVKTRLGWDSDSIVILETAKMLESIGVKALTVHCRTRAQGHSGSADWSWIPKIKEKVSIPIIANGDITSPEKAKYLFDEMNADGIMIARAAIGNPFIFREIKHYLKTGKFLQQPGLEEKISVLIEHLKLTFEVRGKRGIFEFRKHYSTYLKGLPNIASFRAELMQYTEIEPILEKLNIIREIYKNYEHELKKVS
jgi:tRNA-dihydrouridine synthase B